MHSARFIDLLRRLLAVGSVLLVLALGAFAQDTSLHRQLHDATATAASDDGCIVDLFASGVSLFVASAAIPPVMLEWQDARPVATPEIFLDSPRYLLPPERGPPLG